MPSSTATNFQHDRFMNHLFHGTGWSPPATLYVALYLTLPDLTGAGGTEVSDNNTNYSRVAITQGSGWTAPSGVDREISNASDITFPIPNGSNNWGTIVGGGLFDAASGGNLLYVGSLTTPKVVNAGDGAPRMLAGQIRIARAKC